MTHVVMTRFNVRVAAGAPAPGEAWLRDRIHWFERFTLPSMLAQTVPPDAWILFCDADSPDWLIERLPDCATIWRVSGVFTPSVAAEAVSAFGRPLITTRLDNDDAIATDYLEAVRREAPAEGFINFLHGLQLSGDRLYRRSDPSNAFLSRCEQHHAESVFADPHRSIIERHHVRQVKTVPMWLQVIHGRNWANEAIGIRTSCTNLRRFAVDANVTDRGIGGDRVRSTVRLASRVVRRPHRLVWAFRVLRGR